jgi:hypothetical protein
MVGLQEKGRAVMGITLETNVDVSADQGLTRHALFSQGLLGCDFLRFASLLKAKAAIACGVRRAACGVRAMPCSRKVTNLCGAQ